MSEQFFVGVDGGATKCIVRLEDADGKLIGTEITGPANIRISVQQAWDAIHTALVKLLLPLNISLTDKRYAFHAGMGLAGCEVDAAYHAFLNQTHSFATLIVTSDAHTACLGAHQGQDGAIIIAGTGVVGFQLEKGCSTKVSGWGFPHDDEGGGAWLGLCALKITLQWLDGRLPETELAKVIFAHFNNNLEQMVSWANQANSTAYAALAPLVIAQSKVQEPTAIALLQQAANEMNRIDQALMEKRMHKEAFLPCSLVGSIAPFLEPYLSTSLRERLRPCELTPDQGAILLVRQYLSEHRIAHG